MDQPTTSTTTHRGRGRPPKLAGVQYQTQSKQQQNKRNQLTTHNDRQSQVSKTDYLLSYVGHMK